MLNSRWVIPMQTAAIATTIGLAWASQSAPALAGNAVFNQDLATVESAFGRHYTRLTTLDDGTTTKRTYTFNPTRLQAIPGLPQGTKFSIEFVNERAQTVFLTLPNGAGMGYGQKEATAFFKQVLGWTPPTWFENNYTLFGKVINGYPFEETYEYCLGDGVATYWEVEVGNLRTHPKLYYNTECEPPYTK